MDGFILAALFDVLQFQNILAVIVGVAFGLFIGSTPGLTISLGMVLLLPMTFKMPAVTAICLLLGLYVAGMTGGSLSAIVLNIPGTPSASATALDGYEMSKQGRAGEALGVAVISSFFGGIFGLTCLVLASPIIAKFALSFGAPELFALVLLGLTLICSFGQQAFVKALISGMLGLIIMTVGLDPMMGTPRFTFDIVEFQAGISFLPAMIGLFAIPQILTGIAGNIQVMPEYKGKISGLLPKWFQILHLSKAMGLGSLIGTGIGAIPGAGGPIAVFLSYNYVKKLSGQGTRYGGDKPMGVAAPEAANNAVAGGALIPMLTLGIPGDPITAILLGALMIQGLIPGPLLFEQSPQFVYSVFWAYLLANFANLILTLSTIKIWVRVLKVPQRILLPIIAALCVVGTYALRNSFFDTGIMFFFGLMGYFMIKMGFPIVPMLLAIILGPNLEEHLRMSLIISQGDASIFITKPVCLLFLILGFVSVAGPVLKAVVRKYKQ